MAGAGLKQNKFVLSFYNTEPVTIYKKNQERKRKRGTETGIN